MVVRVLEVVVACEPMRYRASSPPDRLASTTVGAWAARPPHVLQRAAGGEHGTGQLRLHGYPGFAKMLEGKTHDGKPRVDSPRWVPNTRAGSPDAAASLLGVRQGFPYLQGPKGPEQCELFKCAFFHRAIFPVLEEVRHFS